MMAKPHEIYSGREIEKTDGRNRGQPPSPSVDTAMTSEAPQHRPPTERAKENGTLVAQGRGDEMKNFLTISATLKPNIPFKCFATTKTFSNFNSFGWSVE
eukprot:Selendium_serpulae@DN930_c0_g1_i1.p1